jgi:muconolactone delta-isomerase
MQILVVVRRRTEAFSEEQFAQLLEPEAEMLRTLYAEGIVRHAWSRSDVLGACLMMERDSLEEAHDAFARLPLAAAGMLEAQLIPLRGYRGFGPRG